MIEATGADWGGRYVLAAFFCYEFDPGNRSDIVPTATVNRLIVNAGAGRLVGSLVIDCCRGAARGSWLLRITMEQPSGFQTPLLEADFPLLGGEGDVWRWSQKVDLPFPDPGLYWFLLHLGDRLLKRDRL
jgi:hypothetical protein